MVTANLEDLRGTFMRLRTKRIALIVDIEKVFLQFGLNEADRGVTRFLWVKEIRNRQWPPTYKSKDLQEFLLGLLQAHPCSEVL